MVIYMCYRNSTYSLHSYRILCDLSQYLYFYDTGVSLYKLHLTKILMTIRTSYF